MVNKEDACTYIKTVGVFDIQFDSFLIFFLIILHDKNWRTDVLTLIIQDFKVN